MYKNDKFFKPFIIKRLRVVCFIYYDVFRNGQIAIYGENHHLWRFITLDPLEMFCINIFEVILTTYYFH